MIEETQHTAEPLKRGRKSGTPDTVKIPINKLLELGGDRLIVQVSRKWLENLVELYSTEGVDAVTAMAQAQAAIEEEPPEPLQFQVDESL